MYRRSLQLLLLMVLGWQVQSQQMNEVKIWNEAEQQARMMLAEARQLRTSRLVFPRTTVRDSLKVVHSGDWTSGFFPGMLWFLYERTKKDEWLKAAQEFTALMVREPFNGDSHDVGFKVYNSYGNGYRLTKDTAYRRLIIQAAKTLSTRFNPKVGLIKSWDFKWQYPVIIDNMMNLELLFAATKFSGDSTFYKIAVTHANTTMKNHFRPDNSSYHVLDYDSVTGQVIEKTTHQGYAPESAWARGQAWGLYGYTMCYRETKNKEYLAQAERIAAFLMKHPALPPDGVPHWDYNVPNISAEPRDASAAAITASALYELSNYSKQKQAYRKMADKIMQSLTNIYRAPPGGNHGFILLHSVGHKPVNSEVDVPIIYADYYYMEALFRKFGKRPF
jgi:unsaturated chondroitin disaccharide hydrolase